MKPAERPRRSVLDAALTTPQREAVSQIAGALLLLAGPGSGKTRTITHRIAHMLEQGVSPRSILAITFTNKAAREMAERVEALAPGAPVWVTTFHKFCARLLRRRAAFVGLDTNYSIIDSGDQQRLLREVMGDLDLDATHYTPARVASEISNAKNELITPDAYRQQYNDRVADHWQAVIARVYPAYQKRLREANSVDFDDLLLDACRLLTEYDEVREEMSRFNGHIMVDEYQDTNQAQYRIVAALASGHRNLCVTGDPDQSIYGWRGARIDNILNFERDFPEAKVVRLEENFRSTAAILRCADALIDHNTRRKAKTLKASKEDGRAVRVIRYDDGTAEADAVAEAIRQQVADGQRTYADFAIFYRVNSMTREVEIALNRKRVPVQIAQGARFFERAEVRDVVGYLRLIANPADRAAFLRVVNKPQRRLGQTSQNKLAAWADAQGWPLLEAAGKASECEELSKPAKRGFESFAKLIASLDLAASGSMERFVRDVVERTAYLLHHRARMGDEGSAGEQARAVVDNVEEIITAAAGYDRRHPEDGSLDGFLEETALVSDVDSVDASQGQVTMMTLHAAKGLEFPCVFLIGLEQGLLPHERSLRSDSPDEIEEERRLLFVGMTRAEEELTITRTAARVRQGRTQISIDSQFLGELDAEMVDATDLGRFGDWSGQDREGFSHADDCEDWGGQGEWEEPSIAVGADPSPQPVTARVPAPEPSLPNRPAEQAFTEGDAAPNSQTGSRTTPSRVPRGASKEAALEYAVGQKVRHPQYGAGEVVAVNNVGRLPILKVQFGEQIQSFVAGKAPLSPAGF